MKKETYQKMIGMFRENPHYITYLHNLNKGCTLGMYLAYPLLLVYLFLNKQETFLRALLVPAISFILLTVVRKCINRKRPYEKFETPPVIPKDTKGNSFPSRHVFSAGIIAMTFLMQSPWNGLGMVLLCVCVILAVVRVLSGVHYISDVLAGLFFAVLCGLLGYGFF